jgi:hypothetical protein
MGTGAHRPAPGARSREPDFVLTLRTPLRIEHWDFGWNLQDVDIAGSGGTLRERFGDLMRSLLDDHMEDLAERGLRPDRSSDELLVRLEIPDGTLRRIT